MLNRVCIPVVSDREFVHRLPITRHHRLLANGSIGAGFSRDPKGSTAKSPILRSTLSDNQVEDCRTNENVALATIEGISKLEEQILVGGV